MGRRDAELDVNSRMSATGLTRATSLAVEQQVAEYFSLLSEPMRLHLLDLLRDGEKCVQELVEATQTSQANVSKHLKVLWQAGILARRSAGTAAYYSVKDETIFHLCHIACQRIGIRVEQQARQLRVFRDKHRGAIASQR